MPLPSHDVRSGLETAHRAYELPDISLTENDLTFFLGSPKYASNLDERTIGPRYEHVSEKLMLVSVLATVLDKAYNMFCAWQSSTTSSRVLSSSYCRSAEIPARHNSPHISSLDSSCLGPKDATYTSQREGDQYPNERSLSVSFDIMRFETALSYRPT
jgi:hypothetical protein